MRNLRAVTILVVALLLSSNAQAALIPVAGGLGVYDDVNNVTWASDGNLFATQAASYSGGYSAFVAAVISASGGVIHDTPSSWDTVPYSGNYTLWTSDFYSQGVMTWWGAKAWVNYLNATNYAGTSTWALPTTVDRSVNQSNSSSGYPNGEAGNPPQSSSQMAQLFYGGLGQVAGSSITATHNSSYALFSNLQSSWYWSGTEYSERPNEAWDFFASTGIQDSIRKGGYALYALAVAPGDISTVPEPSVALLLGTGLLGVLGLRRRSPNIRSACIAIPVHRGAGSETLKSVAK